MVSSSPLRTTLLAQKDGSSMIGLLLTGNLKKVLLFHRQADVPSIHLGNNGETCKLFHMVAIELLLELKW